jgi:membrane-bound lytic murein transglycosylase D
MEKTISKTRLFKLFLISLAAPLVGCTTTPPTPSAVAVESPRPEAPATKPAATGAVPVPKQVDPVTVTAASPRVSTAAPKPTAPVAQPLTADDGTLATAEDDIPAIEDDNTVWARLRAGFKVQKLDNNLVRAHERWFVENARFREAMFERSKLYLYYIVEEVEKRGMPMEIALLPAIESAYKPYAYSRARASGLWQFIPSTGRLYGLKTNWWYDGRRDVIASTRAALNYLQKLEKDFNGDWHLALAAYNAGEGRVGRAVAENQRKGLPADYPNLKQLAAETKNYVPKLEAVVNIVSNPEKYGITLPEIPNEPYFARVETNSQIDLGVIARLTGMEVTELHHINPGYVRWATDPDGPHHVLVPADKKDLVIAGLENLPANERVEWRYHHVTKGDTLHNIARRYNMTVDAIKVANKLSGPIRVGQNLLLPISRNAVSVVAAAPAAPVRAVARSNRGNTIHQVRKGETLYGIAKRYGVSIKNLAAWNQMKPNDTLRYGQKLRILREDPDDAPAA